MAKIINGEENQVLEDIVALEKKKKTMQQEALNKSHDPEMTPYGKNDVEELNLENIGEKDVEKAFEILKKYKDAKTAIDNKIKENEEFWKLHHWEVMEKLNEGENDGKRIKPKSAWLFNTIINKHADAMDNYPEANILPRARDDEKVAKILSDVIPVIMEQNDYEKTYSDCEWYKQKNGTSAQGIFWNNEKNNGIGDIEIKKIDILNLFWKPGVTDIQDSPHVFHVQLMDNDEIKDRYPNVDVGINTSPMTAEQQYNLDEKVDDSDTSVVVDWYYKKRITGMDSLGIPTIRTILHYCKFCNGKVIYASENDPQYCDRGWYDHGEYPFVVDALYPVEGSICGIGYIDIQKDPQEYIDKMQQAFLENTIANARPRWAVKNGAVNEDEFCDFSKPLVHFEGHLDENSVKPITINPMSGIYETVYLQKVQEMKDTSGNTAASQGQASSVTSASGIASLQEAAGKLSRDNNKSSYRAYRKVVYQVIELIRQFYNEPRCFRITGEDGSYRFVEEFDNTMLREQEQGVESGIDMGSRLPIMDIEVRPQKRSAYSRESQNQTALQFYSAGFFTPGNADNALACLEMMEFDGIEKVRDRISANGTMFEQIQLLQQQMMQLSAIVDSQNGTNLTNQMIGQSMQTQEMGNRSGTVPQQKSNGSLSSQAANATRNSTSPR